MMLLRLDPHDVEAGDFLMGHGEVVTSVEFERCRWWYLRDDRTVITSVPMSARVTVHRDRRR